MTDSVATAVPDKGLIARAIGIITAPTETFRVVVQYPRPAFILLLVAFVIGLSASLPQFTDKGRIAALEMQVQQTEAFMGTPVTPELYAAMEGRSHYGKYIAFGGAFVGLPIFILFFTALYWGFFNAILAGTASFKQVLGVVAHSQVITALGAVLGAPIQLATGKMTTAGPFNLGALAPMLEPGSFVANFLGSLGIFAIWGTIVTAIGLGVLYHRNARNIAISLLAITAIFVAGVAYFTSGR